MDRERKREESGSGRMQTHTGERQEERDASGHVKGAAGGN